MHEGSVPVGRPLCADCGLKQPSFGLPTDGKVSWCSHCAKQHPGAVDVVNNREFKNIRAVTRQRDTLTEENRELLQMYQSEAVALRSAEQQLEELSCEVEMLQSKLDAYELFSSNLPSNYHDTLRKALKKIKKPKRSAARIAAGRGRGRPRGSRKIRQPLLSSDHLLAGSTPIPPIPARVSSPIPPMPARVSSPVAPVPASVRASSPSPSGLSMPPAVVKPAPVELLRSSHIPIAPGVDAAPTICTV